MNKNLLIKKIDQIEGITSDEKLYLTEILNTKTKYGLVWEDSIEDIEEQIRIKLPVLSEIKEKAIIHGDQNPNHILIEGENLHSLTNLLTTHEKKIDIIYIDPPYNTGNKDFRYNDSYIDRDDIYRHSKWLSFMHKRLLIAKRLLTDSGVIFISIDDNECSQLKLLCDEIFGENNFVANKIWKSKSGGAADSSFIATDTENILMYANKISELKLNKDDEATVTTSYNKIDGNNRSYALERLDKQNIRYSKSLDYTITGPDGKEYRPQHKDPTNPNATWRWSKKRVEERYDELVFENGNVYTKNYKSTDGVKPRNLLVEERFGRTRTGKTELYSIVGPNNFTAPKPSRLISYLIKLIPNKNTTVLDFFAGSGTTLHAVLNLNRQDGGKRKAIICTNNENNICEEVTYKRAYNLINGYVSGGNQIEELFHEELNLTKLKKSKELLEKIASIKQSNEDKYHNIKIKVEDNGVSVWGELLKGEKIKGLKNNNLRYYKTDFVSNQNTKKDRTLLSKSITELIQIKEDCYTFITSDAGFLDHQCNILTNSKGKYIIVIYDNIQTDFIAELINYIKRLTHIKGQIDLYCLNQNKEFFTETLKEHNTKVNFISFSDSIYTAYGL